MVGFSGLMVGWFAEFLVFDVVLLCLWVVYRCCFDFFGVRFVGIVLRVCGGLTRGCFACWLLVFDGFLLVRCTLMLVVYVLLVCCVA